MMTWYGLFVQGATPRGVISKLQQEVAQILNQPDMKERIAADGMTVVASTPEQFAQFLEREHAKYARIIEAAGIKRSTDRGAGSRTRLAKHAGEQSNHRIQSDQRVDQIIPEVRDSYAPPRKASAATTTTSTMRFSLAPQEPELSAARP